MTCKEQNKILDAKIESNVNQYKVDRLNAEISAFSSGDLNKYEFLKRIDLNYKPNALDKARFEFSPLGKTFNTGLDKNVQGYQEECIIKLLKDIRDGLAGGITPRVPKVPGAPRTPDNDDDDDDDDDEQKRLSKLLGELRTDEDNKEFKNEPKEDKLDKFVNNMSSLETEKEATLNKFKEMVRNKEDEIDKSLEDKKNRLNKLNDNVKKIKYYIKENNDQINNKEKEYSKLLLKYSEINRDLNKTKDELYRARNDINEQKTIQERLNYQNNEAEELKRKLNEKKEDIKNLENINKISNDKVFDVLNKFKNNMENKISDLDKMVTSKEDEWNTKLNKLNNDAKKIDNYIKKK